jgi:protein LSM14
MYISNTNGRIDLLQMTVQPSMGQQSYQPQPGYGHPMMGQMGPMSGQYGPPYGMSMGTMGPMMGMGPAQNRQPMTKQPSELGLGPSEPSAISIQNSQLVANIEPLPKDQSLEDGKLFLLFYL